MDFFFSLDNFFHYSYIQSCCKIQYKLQCFSASTSDYVHSASLIAFVPLFVCKHSLTVGQRVYPELSIVSTNDFQISKLIVLIYSVVNSSIYWWASLNKWAWYHLSSAAKFPLQMPPNHIYEHATTNRPICWRFSCNLRTVRQTWS